jgi:hypothetical protein
MGWDVRMDSAILVGVDLVSLVLLQLVPVVFACYRHLGA